MPPSRAIVVLGMHRSGTSVLTRGLQSAGVYLGNDFLSPQPDNPTGYWEDKGIVDINERLLRALGSHWESTALIDAAQWQKPEVQTLREEAAAYLQTHFLQHPLWGFKDPRTIRLLPFWRALLQDLGVEDQYLLAIRNPLGVAISLLRRQNMPPAMAHAMALVHLVPYLHEIACRPLVVTDFDLLIAEPRAQIDRIAGALNIPLSAGTNAAIEDFAGHFLDPTLRHGHFDQNDFDAIPVVSPLIREAYLWLYQLATDQVATDSPEFWSNWDNLRAAVETAIPEIPQNAIHGANNNDLPEKTNPDPLLQAPANKQSPLSAEQASSPAKSSSELSPSSGLEFPDYSNFRFAEHSLFPGTGVRLFVVIGSQRTGTNLLREILNTNELIAMQGEVLCPSPAPAHWENFIRGQPAGRFPSSDPREVEALLDHYFRFVLYRIRNHWMGADKSHCHAIGVDIKYNQLRELAPSNWPSSAPPFLLSYLKARGATLIHATRQNLIHCALSAMIADQRSFWHNYEGVVVDQRYLVDAEQCLNFARTILIDRATFSKAADGCKIIECRYEDLAAEIERVSPGGEIPDAPGPLRDVAHGLQVPFQFTNNGRLQKAINVPYSQLLLNRDDLIHALANSEFSEFASTLA